MTRQKIILIAFLVFVLIIVAWYAIGCPLADKCPGVRPPKKNIPKVIMTFVGPSDDSADWEKIFSDFNKYKKIPENGFLDVIIKYERLCNPICSAEDYEDEVRKRMYKNEGPNIFMISNEWVRAPRFKDIILPAPAGMMTIKKFESTFAKVAKDDLTDNERNIYSLPFYIDTLALYYDENAFLNKNLIRPPKNWNEFTEYAKALTILDKNGEIMRAGAAFGGGSNVNRSQDILMLLVMQNNSNDSKKNLVSFDSEGSAAAVNFYTSFTDPKKSFYTWNEDQIYSIDAFTQKKAAMMINYSYHIENVIEKTSSNLNFKIAPIPQTNENNKINYASYWTPVVPQKAPCGKEKETKVNCYLLAWEFINFAARKDNIKSYLDATNRPAANLELAEEQFTYSDDMRSVFAEQVLTAKSWDHPEEGSLSDKILIKMIDSIITKNEEKKQEVVDAMDTAKRFISSLNL